MFLFISFLAEKSRYMFTFSFLLFTPVSFSLCFLYATKKEELFFLIILDESWGHLYSANFPHLLHGWGDNYQSTGSFVRTKVNYLVFSVLSIENSHPAINMCRSSLMSADQKPIKNTRQIGYQIMEGWRWRIERTRDRKIETAREKACHKDKQLDWVTTTNEGGFGYVWDIWGLSQNEN